MGGVLRLDAPPQDNLLAPPTASFRPLLERPHLERPSLPPCLALVTTRQTDVLPHDCSWCAHPLAREPRKARILNVSSLLAARLPERQVLTKPVRRECGLMVCGFGHAAGTHSLGGPTLWTPSPGTGTTALGGLAAPEACGGPRRGNGTENTGGGGGVGGPVPGRREHRATSASRCLLARRETGTDPGSATELDAPRGGRRRRKLKR